jgi:heme a synthase
VATIAQSPPAQSTRADHDPFRRFAWAVLGWNVVVVLWGAYVRASGSGAGCGSHWPLCNGEVMPRAPRLETVIEFTHRLSSGVALIAVAALCIWGFRRFPRGNRLRWTSGLSLFFLLMEAALGAGLVLFEYVDKNASVARAVYLSAHLANTMLLLAALTATAWLAHDASREFHMSRIPGLLIAALPAAIFVCISGTVAALGDTLFPVASLAEGMRQDWSTTANILLRLRVLHPVLAAGLAVFLILIALSKFRAHPSARTVALLALIQAMAGAMNLAMLAPVWMQIVHLLLADLLWIALVILSIEAASPQGPRVG